MKKFIGLGISLLTHYSLDCSHLVDTKQNEANMQSRIELHEKLLKKKQDDIAIARSQGKSAGDIKKLEKERAGIFATLEIAKKSLRMLKSAQQKP